MTYILNICLNFSTLFTVTSDQNTLLRYSQIFKSSQPYYLWLINLLLIYISTKPLITISTFDIKPHLASNYPYWVKNVSPRLGSHYFTTDSLFNDRKNI